MPQVGVAGFFIDLAVRDPGGRGGFLLGIECDGAAYHSAKSIRDRDALRQQILEGLGWTIHRIWSTDWFNDPRRELERLVHRIEELDAAQEPSPRVPEAETIVPRTPVSERLEVDIGDRVTIAYCDAPDRRIGVRITPERHAPEQGWVHARHPFGLALIGNAIGDEVEIDTAIGRRVAKIISVEKD